MNRLLMNIAPLLKLSTMRIFCLSLVLLLSCMTGKLAAQNKQAETYFSIAFYQPVKFKSENWFEHPPVFSTGHYYQFADFYGENVFRSPLMLLGFLLGQGIELEEAWFRGHSTRCGYAETIVDSSLAIRVRTDKQAEALKKFGFVKTNQPAASCPNGVTHYFFGGSHQK